MALPVEKPYDNKLCDDTFRWLSSSHIQDRTHTREKPQECTQCGKVFISSNSFQKH
jgi:KRAB domain-containing zinc finger protein